MNFQPAAISGNLVSRTWSGDMIAPLSDGGQGTAASFVSQTFEHDGSGSPSISSSPHSVSIAASSTAIALATTC